MQEASRNPSTSHRSEIHGPPSTPPGGGIDYYAIFSPFPTGSAGLSKNDKQPFFLTFVKGNISRCAGCGLKADRWNTSSVTFAAQRECAF